MNRLRLVFTVTMLLALTAGAYSQQTSAATHTQKAEHAQSAASEVDQHLKVLSEKLALTVNQQAEIRPILKQMLEERRHVMQDSSLSDDARHEKEKTLHEKADKEARRFLDAHQNKKLNELEQQHP